MGCDANGCPILENYQGRQIVLTPGHQEDGTWICEYVITKLDSSTCPSTKGCADGTFHSANEARVAALLTAKTIINSQVQTSEATLKSKATRRSCGSCGG
jgi:hypothetical protein